MTREPEEWNKLTLQKDRTMPAAHISIPCSTLALALEHSQLKDLDIKTGIWMARRVPIKSDRYTVKVLIELKPLTNDPG